MHFGDILINAHSLNDNPLDDISGGWAISSVKSILALEGRLHACAAIWEL